MSALVGEGTLILARADRTVSPACLNVLTILAGDNPPVTLDALTFACEARYSMGRRWVFYAVGELEEREWIPVGVIR